MSCHVEFDFNDDGTLTMTYRPKKGADVQAVTFPKDGQQWRDSGLLEVPVLAGGDDTQTHTILIGKLAAMHQVKSMSVAGPVAHGMVSVWSYGA